MANQTSPVIELLDSMWTNTNNGTAHSWERLNWSMRSALKLAITAGYEWQEADYRHVLDHYSSSRWIGDSDEWAYATAIETDNASAIKSFEAAHKRSPFIADDVEAGNSKRERERLAVGFTFTYGAVRPTVTSFAADYLTACTYKPQADGDYRNKIDRRFKITRADIIADRAQRKERAELLAKLTEAAKKPGSSSGSVMKLLAIKSREEFDAIPLARIRKVLEKLTAA